MAAVGDREEDGSNPPYVRLKSTCWSWKEVKLPTDLADTGPLASYYMTGGTRGEFYLPAAVEVDNTSTWVPTIPVLPAKIAREAMSAAWTPWDMYVAVKAFAADKEEATKSLLKPVENWALAASTRGRVAADSKMAISLLPVANPHLWCARR